MRLILLMIISAMIAGCGTLGKETPENRLSEARQSFQAGELYRAKRLAMEILDENPSHTEAQHLMAEVLDSEIALHKEAFETKAPEEFTRDEKEEAVKTWMERARSLESMGRLDEAAEAAENVFIHDPENTDASEMVDRLRLRLTREGKDELGAGRALIQEEMNDRIAVYRKDVKKLLAAGRPGAARLAVEKLLLLAPEDEEGLRVYEELRHQA